MIYLDSASTTRMDESVLEAMIPYLKSQYGNPGSIHTLGRASKGAIEIARDQVADFIGGAPEQIVFTSGGSESNSMVFSGIKEYLTAVGKKHILVSNVEHDSVLKAAEMLIKDGFDIEYIPVFRDGTVRIEDIENRLREDTGLVSVMYVNNETGAENPVVKIGDLCHRYGILFHTDCVQAASCCKLNVDDFCCDFMSISSHKIHGPKGVGALFVRDKNTLSPLVCGGIEQEHGIRGGTENVAGIVGFGRACEILEYKLFSDILTVLMLSQRFYTTLQCSLEQKCGDSDFVSINGKSLMHRDKILNIKINGIDSETLLLMLDGQGVCMSAGSACRSHNKEPSHVLTAMGLSEDEARSSIRISFSRDNTVEEVIQAAKILADSIVALKSVEATTDGQ